MQRYACHFFWLSMPDPQTRSLLRSSLLLDWESQVESKATWDYSHDNPSLVENFAQTILCCEPLWPLSKSVGFCGHCLADHGHHHFATSVCDGRFVLDVPLPESEQSNRSVLLAGRHCSLLLHQLFEESRPGHGPMYIDMIRGKRTREARQQVGELLILESYVKSEIIVTWWMFHTLWVAIQKQHKQSTEQP